MAGWHPPLVPHEIDDLGNLGLRIQATIEEASAKADPQDEVERLDAENGSLLRAFIILRDGLRVVRTAVKNKNLHSIIDRALEHGEEARNP